MSCPSKTYFQPVEAAAYFVSEYFKAFRGT